MIIKQERLTEKLIGELNPIIEAHKDEVASFDLPLCVNWQAYDKLQEAGHLKLFVARDEGIIVGYCSCFIHSNMHYSTSLQCFVDAVYLDPEYRGKMLGIKLFRHVEDIMTSSGIDIIQYHVKVQHDFSPVLSRLGYAFVEKIMAKRI